jgi:site-specific DNA-methyltransferase (adenine-specific)
MKKSLPSDANCGRIGKTGAAAIGVGKPKPIYHNQDITLYCGDCREIVPHLTDRVNLLLTDPPYSRVKTEAWDRLNQSELCRLLDDLFQAVRPKLATNAAIYVFAWPTSASIVEHVMSRHFHMLQHIVWQKRNDKGCRVGAVNRQHVPGLRNFCPETERILFAEQYGAEKDVEKAKKADRDEVFRPLIEFFRSAREASGLSAQEIQERMFQLTGKRYAFERHAFSFSQWEFPAKSQFLAAATFLPLGTHGDVLGNYEAARERYDELRSRWDVLRRPHHAKPVNFTDIWTYCPIVSGKPRVHPCQKPMDMIRDMIETSSNPGDLVLDCFAGSGQTAIAAREVGRRCILIEQDPDYCKVIIERLQ